MGNQQEARQARNKSSFSVFCAGNRLLKAHLFTSILLSSQGPSFQQGDVIVSGFMTVAKQLVQFATNFVEETKTLIGSNSLENAEIQQWMSYCETHIKPIIDDVQGINARAEVNNQFRPLN